MTVASGAPFWARTNTFEDYGGDENKRNYGGRGVVDPRTDLDAGQVQRMATDLACLSRVAPMATIMVDGASSPTVTHAAVGPVGTVGSYGGSTPPVGFPNVRHLGTGIFRVDFDASYTDESGASAAFTPTMAYVTASGKTSDFFPAVASAYITSGYVLVYVWNVSGAPALADNIPFTLQVWG